MNAPATPPDTSSAPQNPPPPLPADAKEPTPTRHWGVLVALVVITAATVAAGQTLVDASTANVNHDALASHPLPVTTVAAQTAEYRAKRRYIGTLRAWEAARVGPQVLSAYVQRVLVRPGAVVRQGEVLAELDCRHAHANLAVVEQKTRSAVVRRDALVKESSRVGALKDSGFVAANEVEQLQAKADAEHARVEESKAEEQSAGLRELDCVLRAPFAGEIAERWVDPGAFVRPGDGVVSVVDRRQVRLVFDVPETDYAAVAPGKTLDVLVLAGALHVQAVVSRRSPSADPGTRTVHVEADLANNSRTLPLNTTAEVRVELGAPVPALSVPLTAVDVRGERASFFIVDKGKASKRRAQVLGEAGSMLFITPDIPPDAPLITEGRALLKDGDAVLAHLLETAGAAVGHPEGGRK